MTANSKIEWTHHTFNPWWGCARVSPGCEHCYAEAFAKRTGKAQWGVKAERRFFGDKHWNEPLKWDRAAKASGERHRVFCASMADVFEDRDDLRPHRARLYRLIEETPNLDWLLLTKRPENASKMLPWSVLPWKNVWLGVTAEDQRRADERIPVLLSTPAAVRFVSYEPALEPVDFSAFLPDRLEPGNKWMECLCGEVDPADRPCLTCDAKSGVDWVIVGGESGPGARPFAIEWASNIVEQCAGRAACFVKQLGAVVVSEQRTCPIDTMKEITGRDYDRKHLAPNGEVWAWRAGLKDRKGGDPSEWPDGLNVRQWPEVRHG